MERQSEPGAGSRLATPALAGALPLALAFLVGPEAPETLGGASFPAVARTAAGVAAVGALAAELVIGGDRRRLRGAIAVASAALAVVTALLVTRVLAGEEQRDAGARLSPAELAKAPDILLVVADAPPQEGLHDESPWGDGYLSASRRRATDLASILTGLGPIQHGVLSDGDDPRSPTLLEHLADYGYEVGAFLGEGEELWCARGAATVVGGLEGARDWLDGGTGAPRCALVTGVGLEEGRSAIEAQGAQQRRRREVRTIVAMDSDGWNWTETPRGRRGHMDYFGVPVFASWELPWVFFEEWGVPVPAALDAAQSARWERLRRISDRGAIRFTPGAPGATHRLELHNAWGELEVDLTRLDEDPALGWEIGGTLASHLVYRNRLRWSGGEEGRESAMEQLGAWYEAVVLPARAERSGKAGRGL